MIADALRRAHLIDGVPWSQMAVIVRSVPRAGARLPRALAAAGVPVAAPAASGSLVRGARGAGAADGAGGHRRRARRRPGAGIADRAHRSRRPGVAAAAAPDTAARQARSTRRAMSVTCWSAALSPAGAAARPRSLARCGGCARCWTRPPAATRTAKIRATRCGRPGTGPVCSVAGWRPASAAAPPAPRPAGTSRRSPRCSTSPITTCRARPARRCADSSSTSRRCSCRASSPIRRRRQSRSGCSARTPRSDTNGIWWSSPACRKGCGPTPFRAAVCWAPSGLLDVLDGVTEDASVRAPLLAEERRLLVAAMGRARRRLLVTAVDSDTGGAGPEAALPSPFFCEIAQWADGDSRSRCARSRSQRRGCCRRRRWWAGCAVSCVRPTAPWTTSLAIVRQRNWRGWPRPVCRAPTRPAGTV